METQHNSDTLMDRKQAAEYLRVCKTTLDRLDCPKIRLRRRVLFSKITLDKWLLEHTSTVEAKDE